MSRAQLIEQSQSAERPRGTEGQAKANQSPSALHDSEELLRAILRTAVEGIVTIDEKGIIESINPAAEHIFGWKASEVIGKNVSILMPPPYRQKHDGYIKNYLRTGQAKIIGIGREVVGQRKDSTVFPMDLAVSEVRLAGRRLFTGFIRDISDRKKAEIRQAELTQEILDISDRERQRIGQDLHDGLCQQLAGIELMSQVLEQKLAATSKADAARAAEIGKYVRDAISQTRLLARGLSPVTLEAEGLMSALQELAGNTEKMFRIRCRFECAAPVLIKDLGISTHLYRIAQEAVSNAIKHGKAKNVVIRLEKKPGTRLTIADDGLGFRKNRPAGHGMGLRIMQYRAGMVNGTISIEPGESGGVTVTCSVPPQPRPDKLHRKHAPP